MFSILFFEERRTGLVHTVKKLGTPLGLRLSALPVQDGLLLLSPLTAAKMSTV